MAVFDLLDIIYISLRVTRHPARRMGGWGRTLRDGWMVFRFISLHNKLGRTKLTVVDGGDDDVVGGV